MKTDLIQVPTLADIQQAFECQNQLKVRCFQKLIRIPSGRTLKLKNYEAVQVRVYAVFM